ncbi:hypothetical protein [Bacteroides finegoldii]|jgi:hypothetical protein|uniref:hypothetical protein n=1 Tax=Bacteroides finegoldii TaxID=338188 RepID=UPI002059BDC2|nr:hypothetical protein [Bacteroides finegoldii]DAU34246.1 MAG TPA: hypothetical protein [Bacteriophage sp.]
MAKIAITRITVVNDAGQKMSHNGRVIIDSSELEDYRKFIKRDGNDINRVLFIYEEVEDD